MEPHTYGQPSLDAAILIRLPADPLTVAPPDPTDALLPEPEEELPPELPEEELLPVLVLLDTCGTETAFLYTLGFVRPLGRELSDLSLAKMIYGARGTAGRNTQPAAARTGEAVPAFSF